MSSVLSRRVHFAKKYREEGKWFAKKQAGTLSAASLKTPCYFPRKPFLSKIVEPLREQNCLSFLEKLRWLARSARLRLK
jgi:hypothetical protein